MSRKTKRDAVLPSPGYSRGTVPAAPSPPASATSAMSSSSSSSSSPSSSPTTQIVGAPAPRRGPITRVVRCSLAYSTCVAPGGMLVELASPHDTAEAAAVREGWGTVGPEMGPETPTDQPPADLPVACQQCLTAASHAGGSAGLIGVTATGEEVEIPPSSRGETSERERRRRLHEELYFDRWW